VNEGTLTDDLLCNYEATGTQIECTTDPANWNTAYGWGDHGVAGYNLQSYASSTYVWASDWTTIDDYPSACGAGEYMTAIGDTLTCSVPSGGGVSSLTSSTSTYDGIITYGGYTGYYAADLICDDVEAGSHFCDTSEVGLFLTGNASSTIDGITNWVKEYAPGFTANANDCKGFTDNSSTFLGAFIDNTGAITPETESYWLTNCAVEKKLICCL